ncbi:MAG: CDP-glycerol glycerophosphotransferase family protein [Cellulomonadaceae bacterium]|nr:CDP-glycerol glycerophosphotransferase family protein [Cellulomonadaceae bacterium]
MTKNLTDAEGTYHSPVPPALADRIVDLSGQYNVNDLLHVADVLITNARCSRNVIHGRFFV